MKTNKHIGLAVMALASFLFLGTAYAEDKNTTTQSHEEHHPEGQVKEKSSGHAPMGENGGMMGKMDMNQMMDMMHECMAMHKDGKMCNNQTMEKCQENMSVKDCKKMMAQSKKQEKANKKEK